MVGSKRIVVRVGVWCGLLTLFLPSDIARYVHAQMRERREVVAHNAARTAGRRDRGQSGIRLELAGTERAYFTRNGKPLLSFGGLSDFIFYMAEDAYDYKRWADWAAAHGMNHVRAYPPLSFNGVERLTLENGGKKANVLFPYRETSPGSRQFDLTQFDDAYWKRLRAQCEYLQSKGIVIHLLMSCGFHIRSRSGWSGSFFNPANNVNAFTDHLPEDHLPKGDPEAGFYVLEEGKEELTEAQKAWFYKVLEETHDLDNVYYDLVHEIGHHLPDWDRLKPWIEAMALATRQRWAELEPNKPIVLGMDAGSFEGMKHKLGNVGMPGPGSQIDWTFSRPYFDILIYGRGHYVPNARQWRRKYKKAYIGQECWDEDHRLKNLAGRNLGHAGYSYRAPGDRVHIRKYLWKFTMAKCQQMDVYVKPLSDVPGRWGTEGYPHNYDPSGWNKFEDDALILRRFWDSLADYPNLRHDGTVVSGPGSHQYILSSPAEAVLYCSSETRAQGERFDAGVLNVRDLALADGRYTAEIVQPAEGVVKTDTVTARNGALRVQLPAFTDDIAVHVYRK